ncbi:MAG: ABC transporter permease [Cytophagales bacterium]|nr:ABC transporter permease [Rhizobacter sp.]
MPGPEGLSLALPVAGAPVSRRAQAGLGVLFWVSAAWVLLVLLGAALAHLLPLPEPTKMNLMARGQGMSTAHWLGTDGLGRDLLSRVVFGARVSVTVGLLAPLLATLLGGALGVMAGYWRGRFGKLSMGAMDVLLTFPPIVLMLVLTAYLGASLVNLTVVLAVLFLPVAARVARAVTLAVSQREFVTAARALGATDARIMLREIVPSVLLPMLSFFLFSVAVVIVLEGALSFLALGLPPPTPSWGSMIGEGRNLLESAPHVAFVPAMVMFITVLALNLIGDAVRAVAEPSKGT